MAFFIYTDKILEICVEIMFLALGIPINRAESKYFDVLTKYITWPGLFTYWLGCYI